MNAWDLKQKFLDFFKAKGHAIIKGAPLIPENDPSVLFTTAGMHPLVPFLLGQPHPMGKRLVDIQKCIRTTDIDEVGDDRHLTFFEMMGNWSLGDYFKKEAINWSYEFLIKILKFDPSKINVTVFAGDKEAPRDDESADIWLSLGIPKDRLFYLGRDDNFWIQGTGLGPCGPCTEIFIDTGATKCGPKCVPGCKCKKYLEVWNNVFMEYNKTATGKYEKLVQKNVDTGIGVERTLTILSNKDNVYSTELFAPLIKLIESKTGKKYGDNLKSFRVVMDHARAATFILGDEWGCIPSNVLQGYVLRRLIRRAIRHARLLGLERGLLQSVAVEIIKMYFDYPVLKQKQAFIIDELNKEEAKFLSTLEKGLREFDKLAKDKTLSGTDAFLLYQSYGFPIEMTMELGAEKGIKVDIKSFEAEYKKHRESSSTTSAETFKGGLSDVSIETTKLHTATHLLAEALRRVLKTDIRQKGSNITPERLRFDFNFDRKLTPEELKRVEEIVNEQIKKSLPVVRREMTVDEAKKLGAQGEFQHKYGEKVFVYSIGDFSKEVCGGPHANNTKELGPFKIQKEESSAAGVRRIKASLN